MTDSPAEPSEWQTGPPPDYDPPPLEDLIDPALHEHTHTEGRDLVLAVLAKECGIRKRDDVRMTKSSDEKTRNHGTALLHILDGDS